MKTRRKVTKRRDLVRLLRRAGFREDEQGHGRHPKFRRGSMTVPVPRDWNGELPPGTIKGILQTAGLDGEWRA